MIEVNKYISSVHGHLKYKYKIRKLLENCNVNSENRKTPMKRKLGRPAQLLYKYL